MIDKHGSGVRKLLYDSNRRKKNRTRGANVASQMASQASSMAWAKAPKKKAL